VSDHPIIEGSFRVVATHVETRRNSPNRRRAAARIVVWNLAFVVAVIAIPLIVR
jgi:hypothetical protein